MGDLNGESNWPMWFKSFYILLCRTYYSTYSRAWLNCCQVKHCSGCGRCSSLGRQRELTTEKCAGRPVPQLPQEGENTGQEYTTVQGTTTSSTVRRNPVWGHEETTIDNYSHIDKSISFWWVEEHRHLWTINLQQPRIFLSFPIQWTVGGHLGDCMRNEWVRRLILCFLHFIFLNLTTCCCHRTEKKSIALLERKIALSPDLTDRQRKSPCFPFTLLWGRFPFTPSCENDSPRFHSSLRHHLVASFCAFRSSITPNIAPYRNCESVFFTFPTSTHRSPLFISLIHTPIASRRYLSSKNKTRQARRDISHRYCLYKKNTHTCNRNRDLQ